MKTNSKNRDAFAAVLSIAILAGAGIYAYGTFYQSLSGKALASSCSPGQFCGGSVSPALVPAGGNYTMSCDYGYEGNGIYAHPGSGSCTYKKFSGTTAEFNCIAGTTPGVFSNNCKLSSVAEPYPSRTDAVNSVTVTSSGGGGGDGPLIPTNATAISDIQNLGNWAWVHDTGTPGDSIGISAIVQNPSAEGSSRTFFLVYNNYGGERYSIRFGNDPAVTHFVYDTWINLATPDNVQNLELDMNQVTANGDTVIYATQCSSISKKWDYTLNVSGHPKWVPSNIPCNPTTWSANSWHHVQIAYQRDDGGNVTYDWVNLDGAVSHFSGATGNSDFRLGWASGALVANVQLDGIDRGGVILAYTNRMTVWRW